MMKMEKIGNKIYFYRNKYLPDLEDQLALYRILRINVKALRNSRERQAYWEYVMYSIETYKSYERPGLDR